MKNFEKFNSKSRINEVDATEELKLSKAHSRNRDVYPCPSGQVGISVPISIGIFWVPFWASKKVQRRFFKEIQEMLKNLIAQYIIYLIFKVVK